MPAGAAVELPWLRASRGWGWPGWAIGAGLGLGLVAVTAATALLGADIAYDRRPFEQRVPFGICIVLGYMVAAYVFHVERARADLERLGAPADAGDALSRLPRAPLAVSVLLGVAFAATGQETTVARWSRMAEGDWNAVDAWAGPLLVAFWATSMATFYAVYHSARVLRVAGAGLDVRLFERRPGRPLARFGLRTFLLWVVVPVLASLLATTIDAAHVPILLFSMLLNLGLGVACLVLPLGGLRARIRALKDAELARLDAAVAGDRAALAGSPLAREITGLSLPALLSYRERVERHPEWPIDAPALGRFALYGLLPLASWVAAALVERVIDAFLE